MKRLIAAVIVLSSLTLAQAAADVNAAVHANAGAYAPVNANTDAARWSSQGGYTQRLIIRFKDAGVLAKATPAQREQAQARNLMSLAARRSLQLGRIRETSQGAVIAGLPAAVTLDQAREIARRVADDPAIAHVEPDVRVFAQQATDPFFASQWTLPSPSEMGGGVGSINATAAWALTSGQGVTVAVIDTGATSHPDLDAAWLPGHDFIGADPGGALDTANDGDGRDFDAADPGDWCSVEGTNRSSTWHGTAVASVIAAQANNGYGIVGAAPGVRILPVRAIGRCGGYMSDVVDAMRWAAGLPVAGAPGNPNPAKVLNLSLGSAPDIPCSILQQQAVDEIVAANVMIVAAAGNEGSAGIGAPANCTQVLAIAAHTRQGELAAYSNFHAAVALTAPGGIGTSITSAVIASSNLGTSSPGLPDPGRGFAGTSAATPHVAAAAALLWSLDPARPIVEIRNALASAARQWPATSACAAAQALGRCGAGMLDVGAAIARLGSQVTVDITAPAQSFAGNTNISITAHTRSSYAPSQLGYRWIQTSGTPAVLADADAATVRVTLPPLRTTVGLRITVIDPLGGQTIGDTTIRVNNEPIAKEVDPIEASPGESIVRSLAATDPDGDAVRYTLLQGPKDLSVGRSDGRLQWTAGATGSYAVRIAIEDVYGTNGKDIDIVIRVGSGEDLSSASPLGSVRSGSGGSGSFGWLGLAILALALAPALSSSRSRSTRRP